MRSLARHPRRRRRPTWWRVPTSPHSAKVYEIDRRVLLRAYRRADDEGLEVIGVFHSHTHSAGLSRVRPTWPRRPIPVVALRAGLVARRSREVRSYRIVEGEVTEEEVGS